MKISLNDLTMIMSEMTEKELRLIKKFITYKDNSNCMAGGSWHAERSKDVCLGKYLDKHKVFVCYAGMCKEILVFCKQNAIKIDDFEDNRTHFDFQKKEFTHDDLRSFFDPKFNYVEHQIRALQSMLKTNTGIIKACTSAGKSSCMKAFMKLTNLPTLILVDKVTLASQLVDDLREYGLDCGLCCGKGVKEGYHMVSTIQSVKKIIDLDRYKCLLVDECFPGKEKVLTEDGLEEISKLVINKSTKKVWSFNVNTKKMELKPITNWFKKETEFDKFIKLTIGRNKVTSTPNHKYYIYNNGIIEKKEAANIDIGDKIVTFANEPSMPEATPIVNKFQKSVLIGTVLGDASLQNVNNRLSRIRFTQGEKQLEYLKYKQHIFKNLFGNVEPYYNVSGYNHNKKIYYISSKSSEELFEYYNKFYKNGKKIIYNIIDEIDDVSLAFWIMDDGSLQIHKANIESAHYELATHSFSEEENNIFIEMFNNKFGLNPIKKFDKRCNKYYLAFPTKDTKKISKIISKYVHPSMNYKLLEQDKNNFIENKEELYNFGYKTVSKKEEIEPKHKTVYNITVEDNHNYIIGEGARVLVSNCHLSSSKTFQDFFKQFGCPLKYGFTASPFNGDYLRYAMMRQFLGSIIIEIGSEELIENEVMAKPTLYFVKNECENTIDYRSAYDINIVNSIRRNDKIITLANMYDRGVAILVTSLDQGKYLESKISGSKFIAGENTLEERKKAIEDFNNGDLRVLIGSNILNTGISISNMYVLIMAAGQKAQTTTIQRVGRCLRITKTKKTAIYYDFIDCGNKFLEKHSKQRVFLFKKEGYKDIHILDEDLKEIENVKKKVEH